MGFGTAANPGLLLVPSAGLPVWLNPISIVPRRRVSGSVTHSPYREAPFIRTGIRHLHTVTVGGLFVTRNNDGTEGEETSAKGFATRFEDMAEDQAELTIAFQSRDFQAASVKFLEWEIPLLDVPGDPPMLEVSFECWEVA